MEKRARENENKKCGIVKGMPAKKGIFFINFCRL